MEYGWRLGRIRNATSDRIKPVPTRWQPIGGGLDLTSVFLVDPKQGWRPRDSGEILHGMEAKMIASQKTQLNSAPIKWHGGKHYLAERILAVMPEHIHYVETHFGGGAVLFRKPAPLVASHSEVINDLDGELTNFWRVLQKEDSFQTFKRRVEATPFSRVEWDAAVSIETKCPIEKAVAFFVRFRQSRQGLGRDFATLSRNRTRRGMNEQASSWWSAVEGLDAAHERLKRVVVVNDDATKLIAREDGPNTFFYVDPPYLHETRTVTNAYRYEMGREQHEALLAALAATSGKFILSGYGNPLYLQYQERFNWKRIDVEIDNKASSSKVKPIKVECLWMNY